MKRKLCMKFFGVLCLLLLAAWPVQSCRFVGPDPAMDVNQRFSEIPPEQLPLPTLKHPTRFSFAFLADLQIDNRLREELRTPSLKALRAYLDKNPVDFFISGGDNTENGTLAEYEYIDQQLRAFSIPVYWCLGNHDLFGDGWSHWKKMYGGSTKVLRLQNTSIYILDNASGTIGNKQRLWLEEQLSQDTATHRIILMHFPLFGGNHFELDGQPHMREAYTLARLFETHKVRHVLAGHTHIYRKITLNGVDYTVTSALKENSFNKTFARIDVDGDSIKTTVVRLKLEGYLE